MINWNGNSGGAVVFVSLFLAVMAEAWIMGADQVEFSDKTVSGFEINEAGLFTVLTNAIEDQRAVVDHLTKAHDYLGSKWLQFNSLGGMEDAAAQIAPQVAEAAEMQFRAMRVLGLLTEAMEREHEKAEELRNTFGGVA